MKDIKVSDTIIELDFWGNGNKDYIESLLNNLELADNISINYKGYNKNVKTVLNQYDIGINPSINEGFGRPTVEYMAAGLCVLALNSGGNMELIKDKKTGFLFDNSNGLTQLIEKCINNYSLVQEMGERGKKWARSKMDMRKNIEEYYSLYSELVLKKSDSIKV